MSIDKINFEGLYQISSNLENKKSHDIVFYNIRNEEGLDLFYKRAKDTNPGLLIINQEINREEYKNQLLVIEQKKVEELQEKLCNLLYPFPSDMQFIGVTGTNGKSTVVYFCSEMLNNAGEKAFSLGTIGAWSKGERLFTTSNTTLSYIELRKVIFELRDYKFCCIELSSHGLFQKRIKKLKLNAIGWTNITQDHLDFHKNMDDYFKAKALITSSSNEKLIIPFEEKYLANKLEENKIPFEIAESKELNNLPFYYKFEYNRKNIALAFSLVSKFITNPSFKNVSLPKGRYQVFEYSISKFVVDYAHTPDGLFNILKETRKAFPQHKIITIFGCGGDRDRKKRVKMLEAILKNSDYIVVTSDNSRTEDPQRIVMDITKGYDNHKKIEVVLSRKEAIRKYIKNYNNPTIVIIAGRGHEEYLNINGELTSFSDIEAVEQGIKSLL